jgi:DNA polymerase III delta subunit
VPESHHLIIFEPSLSSVPAVFRNAAPGAKVIAAEPPRGTSLIDWIEAAAVQAQSRIDRRAAQRLAEVLYPQSWDRRPNNARYDRPPDLARLKSEVEKLALAAHPGPIIVDHIAMLTPGGPDQRVFRFLDAAVGGNLRSSLDELDRLLATGEEPAMLLAQLLGQVEIAAITAEAGGISADVIARDLGSITPGRLSAVMSTTRRRAHQPARTLSSGILTDRNLKTGRIRKPEDALHGLILALLGPDPEGSSGSSR